MKRIMALTFAALLICAAIVPVAADRRTNYVPPEPEKHYSTVTIDDEFEDDVVIVVFNNATSRKLLEYSPEDFPEIECAKVVDQTLRDEKAQLRGEEGYRRGEEHYSDWVSVDDYHLSLEITLANPGKQNVLDAVHLLEQREDVLGVDVVSYVYCLAVEQAIPGDVNADGKINARDVTELMCVIVRGWDPGVNDPADFNADGKINSRDVTALMRSIVND